MENLTQLQIVGISLLVGVAIGLTVMFFIYEMNNPFNKDNDDETF